MNLLSYGISKLGRWSRRIDSLNTLLSVEDLPGDRWQVKNEMTWRANVYPNHGEGEIFERVVKHGGYIAWRSFERKNSDSGAWITIIPYASDQDAKLGVPTNSSDFLKNPNFRGVAGEEKQVDGYQIPGTESSAFFEKSVTGEDKSFTTKFVSGNVNNIVFVVAFTASDDGFSWEEMISMTTRQVDKIKEHFNSFK